MSAFGRGTLSEVGETFFLLEMATARAGATGGPGQGGIPQGGAREFPRGDPNVPVADCVRRNLQLEIT